VGERVATQITREEARERLTARFRPWPNIGYRLSNKPGHSADVTDDGFVVRGLPRLTSTPTIEAVGRWIDRGAEVELRPVVGAYIPAVLVNSVLIALMFVANVAVWTSGAAPLAPVLAALVPFFIVVVGVSLAFHALVLRYLVWRSGDRERRELMTLLRETLGP
jgi:hypothetical protein